MPQSNAVGFDGSGGFGGNFYAAYKHVYGPKRIEPLVYRNAPFMRDARKIDDFEGDSYMHTIQYEDPDTGSTNITQALNSGATSSQTARFAIWRGREYQTINLAAEEVRAARSDQGSLLRKKDTETRRVLARIGYRADIALHNGGSGIIASFTTPASLTGVNQITLDVPAMCVRFGVGMNLQVSTTNPVDGTAVSPLNSGAVASITGIQRSSIPGVPSILTLNQNLSTWAPALATSTQYFLLRAGDGVGFGQNVLNGGVCGLKSWLPAPPPVGTALTNRLSGSDSFWGFNRNADVTRLAGCAYQAQPGEKYQTTFQNAGQELYVNGGGNEPGKMMLYVSPSDYTGYQLELGPQTRYAGEATEGNSGFRRLLVTTQAGEMTLTADPQLEPGLFYMLDKDTYYIKTLDALPHLDEQDGLTGLRLGTADAQQLRWRAWYQLIFDEPGRNLVGRCV